MTDAPWNLEIVQRVDIPSLAELCDRFLPADPANGPVSVSVKDYTEIVLAMGRCIPPFNILVGVHGGILVQGVEVLPAGA